ncbi:MAG: OmpA family protein [Flavobacteriales bacterium]|nr:OmpA family protein [Flavobacteriales bacterium]MDG1765295.1 OmpA family protein [Flavobacteriales bacterium]
MRTLLPVQALLVVAFALLGSFAATAQNKYVTEADLQYDRGGYHEASKAYKVAYDRSDGIDVKGYITYRLGECYRLMTDNAGAEEWYEKSIDLRYYKENPEVYYAYGEVLLEQEKFDEAVVQYTKFKERGGDASRADQRITDCGNASLAIELPPSRYMVEPVVLLNTPFFDFAPTWSSKKNDEIVFGSSRQSSAGAGEDPITGESFMDLFMSEQDKKGKWSTPTPLNNTINTVSNEGASCFDKKRQTMYFTRCVYEKKSNFACDIYFSKRMGANFGPAEPLNIINRESNDSSQVGHPALTPDDMYLLFASDMPGGKGGKDIWYLAYDKKTKEWGKAKNLTSVNTAGDEMFPFVADNGTLYFSSNGHSGLGGLDMFKAESTGDMQFAEVQNLQYPLNSTSDDFGMIIDADKDQGYFTSNRPGGKGKDDIYSFKMPPLEFCYKATVYDFDTGTPLANSKVTIQGTDGNSYALTTDGNGGVSLCEGEVIPETSYSVDVSMEGYIGTGDQFSTVGVGESTTFAREYFLKEIVTGKAYEIPLVLYPFDSADLLITEEVNSADSLSFLFDIMTRNPNFVVQLEAHTDTRGKSGYNKDLSQRRAETCVTYLIGRGIAGDRLVPVGKGEDEPIISDKQIAAMDTEDAQEKAHQVNRRTIFKILRYDYVPKEEEGTGSN